MRLLKNRSPERVVPGAPSRPSWPVDRPRCCPAPVGLMIVAFILNLFFRPQHLSKPTGSTGRYARCVDHYTLRSRLDLPTMARVSGGGGVPPLGAGRRAECGKFPLI